MLLRLIRMFININTFLKMINRYFYNLLNHVKQVIAILNWVLDLLVGWPRLKIKVIAKIVKWAKPAIVGSHST